MTGKNRWLSVTAVAALMMTLAACSVSVDKSKNGEDKKVDIRTPLGTLNVTNDNVTAKDTGFAVYPGAQEKVEEKNHDSKANVSIDTPMFGLKVAAVTYTTNDDPKKVLDFYRDQMKGYGKYIECKGFQYEAGKHDDKIDNSDLNKPVTCGDDGRQVDPKDGDAVLSKDSLTLKTGTNGNQHLVAVKPRQNGTEFSLVYVRIHGGKQDSI